MTATRNTTEQRCMWREEGLFASRLQLRAGALPSVRSWLPFFGIHLQPRVVRCRSIALRQPTPS